MATAISKTALFSVAAVAMTASGCGATTAAALHRSSPMKPGIQDRPVPAAAGRSSGFIWLHPAAVPTGWQATRVKNGAVLRYPPGWRRVAGDTGTATAVLQGSQHAVLGYLNLTPHQANESLRTWAAFRTRHNTVEGDRGVRELAAATSVPFRAGHASCVRDAYITSTGNRFIELACLIDVPPADSVIVGAAPPQMYSHISPIIERAISAFPT